MMTYSRAFSIISAALLTASMLLSCSSRTSAPRKDTAESAGPEAVVESVEEVDRESLEAARLREMEEAKAAYEKKVEEIGRQIDSYEQFVTDLAPEAVEQEDAGSWIINEADAARELEDQLNGLMDNMTPQQKSRFMSLKKTMRSYSY